MPNITFEEWRDLFERSIKVGTPAWTALQTYNHFLEQPPSKLPPWLTRALEDQRLWTNELRICALRLIYAFTFPQTELNQQKQKRDAYTRKTLRDLATRIESFVSHLSNTMMSDLTPGKVIVIGNRDCFPVIDLTRLLDEFQNVATSSRWYPSMLERPGAREPDVLDRSMGLVIVLEDDCKIPERQTLELVRLALLAHGYSDGELEDLRNPQKIRNGTFRKRKAACRARWESSLAVARAHPWAGKLAS